MGKKKLAIFLELIPILAGIASAVLFYGPIEGAWVKSVLAVTMILSVLGFVFFIIARKLAKGDKAVLVLGIIDCLAVVLVIVFYAIAIFVMGL
ncbi:MAG: hypothetical protein IKS48_03975 [Eubacterium sp.]|nr:hypothetical protein [Eubacterium sp.]